MKVLMIIIFLLSNFLIGSKPEAEVPKLNAEDALTLRDQALEHYSVFIDGGTDCTVEEINTPADQEGYYFFCNDLDTIEKIYSYLEETFTSERTKIIAESASIKKINNKLAYPSVGWGSINDWSRAVGVIEKKTNNTITYKFKVPVVNDSIPESEIEISYKYASGKGWRIDSSPGLLK